MKKALTILVLAGALAMVYAPAYAAIMPPGFITRCTLKNNLISIDDSCALGNDIIMVNEDGTPPAAPGNPLCCFFDAIYTATNVLFWFLLATSIIFVLLGAWDILSAGGNTTKITSGRTKIIFASVGFLCALLAKAFPALARWIMGA
ncbi:MAG: hypothetical protein ABIF89_02645 [bacterium]